MGLIFEVSSDQELREKMESGEVIRCIREYFEQLKAEGELPFASEQLTRDNATNFVEVSSYETSIDYHTFAEHRPIKLVQDFRELILLAYDQVSRVSEPEAPAQDTLPVVTVYYKHDSGMVDNAFNLMFKHFVGDLEGLVRESVSQESSEEYCLRKAHDGFVRIDGVISYLYVSSAIDLYEHKLLASQIWEIYDIAWHRIKGVH